MVEDGPALECLFLSVLGGWGVGKCFVTTVPFCCACVRSIWLCLLYDVPFGMVGCGCITLRAKQTSASCEPLLRCSVLQPSNCLGGTLLGFLQCGGVSFALGNPQLDVVLQM